MKLNLFQLSAVVFVMGATTAVYAQGRFSRYIG